MQVPVWLLAAGFVLLVVALWLVLAWAIRMGAKAVCMDEFLPPGSDNSR
jgi:protein-S-isoprenylcysteine O-methyltransferase Ste14